MTHFKANYPTHGMPDAPEWTPVPDAHETTETPSAGRGLVSGRTREDLPAFMAKLLETMGRESGGGNRGG